MDWPEPASGESCEPLFDAEGIDRARAGAATRCYVYEGVRGCREQRFANR